MRRGGIDPGMKRIAWLTDIHLEFVQSDSAIRALCESVRATTPDFILLGGDTATAPDLEASLAYLEKELQLPIYFVLGNHDFYNGSIQHIRALAQTLSQTSRWLRWLNLAGVVELTAETGLIGHDAWADGRLGNNRASQVLLNDYFLIEELANLSTPERFQKLNALGDEAATHFQIVLPLALQRFSQVILLTHVPPFKGACWHEGRISDDEFLPHFTCQAVGDVLKQVMQAHPDCHLTVLCGHTHGAGEATILPNLHVKTGGVEYGEPRLQEVLVVT